MNAFANLEERDRQLKGLIWAAKRELCAVAPYSNDFYDFSAHIKGDVNPADVQCLENCNEFLEMALNLLGEHT